ncbi:MAG: carboxypeptidase-like regulatory domain-containing protein [Gemmatimonadota bacterium]|nr:carboxypeptidase-like regulatory domain-containing protein [Gemmatimonadota bacterium]
MHRFLATHVLRWVIGVALFAPALPLAAAAQSVQGTVLRADSVPASGVIVVATRGAHDSVLARTMTNGNGRFALEVSSGDVRLRALRIGHRPVLMAEFTLAAGARRETRTVLPDDPIVLQAMTTEATSSCRQTGTAGADVATVFEEARKALLSTTLRSRDGDPLARLSVYSQLRSVGNRELSPLELEFQEGVSLKPFQSLRPDSLAKVGYMQNDLSGATYWAPDAEVLLSETFAASHCLALNEGKGDRAGLIGLAFRPQEFRRNYVDVSGTLWLDRATSELRRMEYRYEGLPIAMQRVEPGGEVEFTRLADGTWFVSRWEIRMPRMTTGAGAARLVGTFVKGGEVWRMQRGGALLYSNGIEEPTPASTVPVRTKPSESEALPDRCTPAVPGGPAGLLEGAVFDERGAPLADVVVTVEWQQNHTGAGRQLTWETRMLSTTSLRDGTYAICGIPSAQLLSVGAQYGTRKAPTVAVRLAAGERKARVELRFGGVRAESAPTRVVVQVRDGEQRPVPHALVEIAGGRGRVADDSGRVFLDAAPDTLRISVRRIGYAPYNSRTGRTPAGVFEITLRSLAQSLAAVTIVERGVKSPLELSGFYDRVLRAQRGAFNADFITPEELESRPGIRTSDLFQGRRFVGLMQTKGMSPQKYLMGRGGCMMTIFLDGRLLRPEAPRGSYRERQGPDMVPLDDLVSVNEISAVEIYASAANAPAEMIPLTGASPAGACGIVAIWTGGRH